MLQDEAQLAAWPTPNTPNGGRKATDEMILTQKKADGSKAQVCLENAATLASWATPKAVSGEYQYDKNGEKLLNLEGQAQLTASGATPNGSPAGTEKRGQLNPALSRWLMGLPPEWDDCAVTATQSSRRRRRRS